MYCWKQGYLFCTRDMTFKVFLTQAPSHKKAHITVAQHLQNKMSGKNYLSYPCKNGLESAVQMCLYVCVYT